MYVTRQSVWGRFLGLEKINCVKIEQRSRITYNKVGRVFCLRYKIETINMSYLLDFFIFTFFSALFVRFFVSE